MSNIWTLLRAAAILLGSLAALVVGGLSGTAHADPAPAVPVPNIGDQLISSVAGAPQLLQNLATALGAAPPAPAAPPPLAGANISVPQLPGVPAAPAAAAPAMPSALPGLPVTAPANNAALPGLPLTAPAPIATAPRVPSTGAPAGGPGQLMPQAQVNVPQLPFLPLPLPQQLSLPGDLAPLAPGGLPIPHGVAAPGTSAVANAAAAPAVPVSPVLVPLSALP